ncbi:dihydropteroate synthase [Clostridiales bacterium PH28_bin88]|nr:dihydropteroate synthase [Clostridiales bacterium PH28_bin88]
MGILNVTPDSFSDGGIHYTLDRAVARAREMVEEGADIIDIGGESTRPSADPVPPDEEIGRVIPVLERLVNEVDVPISVDTYKSDLARMALERGATIINDISGLRADPRMAGVVADFGCPVVVMHIKGTPKNMQDNPTYVDVVGEIIEYLRGSIDLALQAGLPGEKIIVDPGIGFGKTTAHNLEIMRRLEEFRALEQPLLIGTSRKSFIGNILNLPVEERLYGTAATVAIAIANGADIVRVHDVRAMKQVAQMTDAMVRWNHDR